VILDAIAATAAPAWLAAPLGGLNSLACTWPASRLPFLANPPPGGFEGDLCKFGAAGGGHLPKDPNLVPVGPAAATPN